MTARWITTAALSLVVACSGDDDASEPDGGGSDAGRDAGIGVAAAAPPAPTPCPDGWRAVGDGPPTCEPWPEGGRAACGGAEAHLPGAEGCAPAGDPCPDGEWPRGLPGGDVRYVRASAPSGGSGRRDDPYGSIAAAMALARGGSILALAKGTYEEEVRVREGVTLWGACAADTRIVVETASPLRDGVVTVSEPDVVLRNLSISGGREGLAVKGSDGNVEVVGVVVDGATRAGVSVFPDGRLTGSDLIVRDTVVSGDLYGYGIAIAPGGSVELDRVVVEGATSSAVAAFEAEVVLEDVALIGSQPQPLDLKLGTAVEAIGGSLVTLRRAALEGCHDRALMVSEPGTEVALEDAVVRRTEPRAIDEQGGNAAFVFDAGSLVMRRATVEDNREVALLVTDADTHLTLEDVVVRDTGAREADGGGGVGAALQHGASGEFTRVLFEANRGIGVGAFSGSTLVLADAVIRSTRSVESDGTFGTGLVAQEGATVEGRRVALIDNRQAGLTAILPGSRITLSDVEIAGTLERACAADGCPGLGFGDGAIATVEASVELTGFVVSESARVGVHLGGGTMDLRRGLIVDNPIGAAVQTPGFDVARISDEVIFVDNERNLDMGSLPLPEPGTGF